jgi:hypothetical protein
MAIQKKIILLLLTTVPMIAYAQNCGRIDRNISRKDRSIYLLDTVLTFQNINEIQSDIKPEDSALVRKIIKNGTLDKDYLAFFQRRGYPQIKKITLKDFDDLPRDSTILTKKEQYLSDQYYRISAEHDSLLFHDKPTARLDKQMRKRKYVKVLLKELTEYPILFGMYPIYRYQNYTLIMYLIKVNGNTKPFLYEICD